MVILKDAEQWPDKDGFDLSCLYYAKDNEWFSNNFDSLPKSKKAILSETIENPFFGNFHCVYFLLAKGEIIYVGKCKNIRRRINNHRTRREINFDAVRILDCCDYGGDLIMVESFYIRLLKPKYNQYIPPLCKLGVDYVERSK